MATSGTVGATVIDTITVLEHAFRRCGVMASAVSGELLQSARDNLYFLLSDLANRGLSLWCVQKYALVTLPDQQFYTLDPGVVGVLGVQYRTVTDAGGAYALSGPAYLGTDTGTGNTPAVIGAVIQLSTPAVVSLVVESSADGVTWVQRGAYAPVLSMLAGVYYSLDLDNTVAAQFWRVRNLTGNLPAVSWLSFPTQPYEVPLGRFNRDDYINLPNKTFPALGQKALQYWYDKQTTPRIWVWPQGSNPQPPPVNTQDQIVVWAQRHIQDVGALTNTLDIPQRWLESIILLLSCRCATEIPPAQLPPGRLEYLEMKSQEHLAQAEDGENDGAPIRLAPVIRGYTR